MTISETLRTLSKLVAALKSHAPATEITYECSGWKMCDTINRDGTVRNFYTYEGEPESLYPLVVTIFALGRSHTITIQSEKELANA